MRSISLILFLAACGSSSNRETDTDNIPNDTDTDDTTDTGVVPPLDSDDDNDGFTEEEGDCNDGQPAINPMATDIVGDGIDQNCDGADGFDGDGDGHADLTSGGDDCDDTEPAAYPGATEVWYDGIDNGCVGGAWEGDSDQDGDGHDAEVVGGDDCDDLDADIFPWTVVETYPEDGSTDAYYRGEIEFSLSRVDPTATITLVDHTGAPVSGETYSLSGTSAGKIYFAPDAPLEPSSAYTATLTGTCPTTPATTTFVTSDVGTPIAAPAVLFGRAYRVDLTTLRARTLPGLMEIDQSLLLEVENATSSVVTLRQGLTEESAPDQDNCVPTTDFNVNFSENPYMSWGPADLPVTDSGYAVTLFSTRMSGAFAPDASRIEGLTLTTMLDVREIMELLGTSDPQDVCDLMVGYGLSCEACPTDGEPVCVALDFYGGVGTEDPALDVAVVPEGGC